MLVQTEHDRRRMSLLWSLVPPTPEGWEESDPERLNDLSAPGVFCRRFKRGSLLLIFLLPPRGRIQVRLTNREAAVTEDEVRQVVITWFKDTPVARTPRVNNTVHFRMGG